MERAAVAGGCFGPPLMESLPARIHIKWSGTRDATRPRWVCGRPRRRLAAAGAGPRERPRPR